MQSGFGHSSCSLRESSDATVNTYKIKHTNTTTDARAYYMVQPCKSSLPIAADDSFENDVGAFAGIAFSPCAAVFE